jgi:hypothetical protein
LFFQHGVMAQESGIPAYAGMTGVWVNLTCR